jgi:hypothetical protein
MYTQVVQNKPTAAYVLSLLAGIFGLIYSIVDLGLVIWLYALASGIVEIFWDLIVIALGIVIWCLISSIIVLVAASRLNANPAEHTKWGAIILIFSIIGLGTLALSEYWYVGLAIALLGIIGGILALAFKPVYGPQQPIYAPQPPPIPPPQPAYAPQQPAWSPQPGQRPITRICPQCGRVIDENVKFCPHCGKALG